jgi:hypothetical protein
MVCEESGAGTLHRYVKKYDAGSAQTWHAGEAGFYNQQARDTVAMITDVRYLEGIPIWHLYRSQLAEDCGRRRNCDPAERGSDSP